MFLFDNNFLGIPTKCIVMFLNYLIYVSYMLYMLVICYTC